MKSAMSKDEMDQEAVAAGSHKGRWLWPALCALVAVVGAATFLLGVLSLQPERAWQTYLINYVFWTGLAFGAVLFSATMTITHAQWGLPMKRLAEALGAFLPVAFLLFWLLYFGRHRIFPWIHEPVPKKAAWLDVNFLFARDGAAIFLLTAVSILLIYTSVRRDQALTRHRGQKTTEGMSPEESHDRAQTVLAPIYAILYAFILTLIAFDLIMSLDPHWYSTLFGAYYFVGSFYTGLAALMIVSGIAMKSTGLEPFIQPTQLHKLANLTLGFCLMTGDFFYTQFLIIWYGNLPEETRFVITRVHQSPWKPLAWVVLIVCFILPFVTLLFRKLKKKPIVMIVLGSVILTGMWLERFVLIAPSLWKGEHIPLGIVEVLVSLGFLGTVSLCVLLFLRRYPALPVSDALFLKSLDNREAKDT